MAGSALRDLTKIDTVRPSGLYSLYMNLCTNTNILWRLFMDEHGDLRPHVPTELSIPHKC